MTSQRAELLTSIYNRYLHALRSTEHLSLDVVQFALTLAIQDVAAALEIISKQTQPAADIIEEHRRLDDVVRRIERVLEAHDSDVFADFAAGNIELPTAIDAVIDSYKSALAAVAADTQRSNARLEQLNRINEWIRTSAGDAYDPLCDDGDTADAMIAVADTLRGQVAKLRHDLAASSDLRVEMDQEIAGWRTENAQMNERLQLAGVQFLAEQNENYALRQQLAQMDADNARLTDELRTVRSWSVAPSAWHGVFTETVQVENLPAVQQAVAELNAEIECPTAQRAERNATPQSLSAQLIEYVKMLDDEQSTTVAEVRAEVLRRDELINKYENAYVMLRAEIKAVPIAAIRAMATEWAAHGMRMTDSVAAVNQWLSSLDGDA